MRPAQSTERHFCRRSVLAVTFIAICIVPFPALGQLLSVVNNGPSSNRVDIVFLGDGYTAADLSAGTYLNHVNGYVDYMFANSLNTDPFYRYRNYFNVHAAEVVSNESGADIPKDGVFRDTALDASYYYDGYTERLLYINSTKANTARNAALAGTGINSEMQFVTVNSKKYGGGGGSYAVFAGGNASAKEIALHEMGHSFSNLADEYDYADGATYTGSEPGQVNVTKDPSAPNGRVGWATISRAWA